MMPNSFWLALALATVGCDDTPAGRSTAPADSLWNLAPAGARGGIVASPYAMAMIERGTLALRSFLNRAGVELEAVERQVDVVLAPLGGRAAKLAELGLTPDKGAALFFVKDGMVAILPIADRAGFVARFGGTLGGASGTDRVNDMACQPVGSFYACASSEPLLATIGKGTLKTRLAKLGVRGDLEVIGIDLPLGGAAGKPGLVVAATQLERGGVTVRGIVENPPSELFQWLDAPVRPRTQIGRSAGVVVLDMRAVFAKLAPIPLVPGVTVVDFANTIAGPVTISIPAGDPTIDVEVPLSDPVPATKVLANCSDVPPLAQQGAKLVGDGDQRVCRIHLEQAGLDLDLWVESNTFHIGRRGVPYAGKPVAMSPAGLEIASKPWGLAIWGRGTVFAPQGATPASNPQGLDPRVLSSLRMMSVIDELGFAARKETSPNGDAIRFVLGVGTTFANPDDVIAKLVAITAAELLANTAAAKAKSIADAHPGSPYAADFAAGPIGLLFPTKLIEAAVQNALPALVRFFATPRARDDATETPGEAGTTKQRVDHYANSVFPDWARANPGKPCPGSIAELAAFVSKEATADDEWNRPLILMCGAQPGATGIAVISAGADGAIGTADDIKSY